MDIEHFIKSIRASKYRDAFEALVEAKRILLTDASIDPVEFIANDLMKKSFTVNDTNPDSRTKLILLLNMYKNKLNKLDNPLAKILSENIEKLNELDKNEAVVSSDDEKHPYAGKPKKAGKAGKTRKSKKTRKTRKSRAKYLAKSLYMSI